RSLGPGMGVLDPAGDQPHVAAIDQPEPLERIEVDIRDERSDQRGLGPDGVGPLTGADAGGVRAHVVRYPEDCRPAVGKIAAGRYAHEGAADLVDVVGGESRAHLVASCGGGELSRYVRSVLLGNTRESNSGRIVARAWLT